MINDTLDSIDLNPIIATLGQDIGSILNSTVGGLTSTASSATSALGRRSFELNNNILLSTNNYLGNTHTNRVLAQNGDIVDQYLNNDAVQQGSKVIGSYQSLMTFNGYDQEVERDGQTVHEKEYTYSPMHGISAVCAIYTNDVGNVVSTQVLAESFAGGSSSIGDL